jgi:hypothetical protein
MQEVLNPMNSRTLQFILLFVGTILIIINAVLIAAQGNTIIISTYPAASLDELQGDWGRIAFGMPGFVSGGAIFVWLFFAILDLVLVILLRFRPRRGEQIGFSVLVLSLLSIPAGGGFYIGMILAVIGSAAVFEKKPVGETFLGRILRSARLDSGFYEKIKSMPGGLRTSLLVVVFLNILTGLGNGLYISNANKIIDSTTRDAATNILIGGGVYFDGSVWGTMINNIGLGVFKWIIFSLIIYFILTRLLLRSTTFETTAMVVAFAYAPIILQSFMPLVFFNQPFLTTTWPLTFFFVTNLWTGLVLTLSIKKTWDINMGQALGVTILGGTVYYVLNSTFIQPTFPMQSVWFVFQPVELVELMLSLGVVLSFLLGVFPKSSH